MAIHDSPTLLEINSFDDRFPVDGMLKLHTLQHAATGWEGALLIDAIGFPTGTICLEYQTVNIMCWHAPLEFRPLDGSTGWQILKPQTRVWLPGEQFHFQWRTGVPCQHLFITEHQIERIVDQSFHRSGLLSWGGIDFVDPVVANSLARMVVASSRADSVGPLLGETLIAELVSHLCHRRVARDVHETMTGARMRAVLDYVRAHLDQPISLANLSAEAHCTPRHFARQFRQSAGISVHQYILNLRIEQACALLRQDRHSFVDIAMATGFSDQSHFTNTFRKFCGTSPSRYRALVRTGPCPGKSIWARSCRN